MKRCVVIYNPNSGKKLKSDFLSDVVDLLIEYDYYPDVIMSKYKGHITEIVSTIEEPDLLISFGGDGTFNEVMTGNFKRKKHLLLAHIPVGTTNDIGKMFGYGKSVVNNLKLLLSTGVKKKMDICTINSKPFVYVAGFGKFMTIPYETKRSVKKKIGYLAYLYEGFKEIIARTKLYDITVTVNGEVYNGLYSFMLIGNATRIGGLNNLFDEVKLDDNSFEVLLCNLRTKGDIVKTLYYLRKTSISHVPGFYFHNTNELKVKFNENEKVNWCIDGEKLESDTNEFIIKVTRNVPILLPNKNIDKLFIK